MVDYNDYATEGDLVHSGICINNWRFRLGDKRYGRRGMQGHGNDYLLGRLHPVIGRNVRE